MEEIVKLILELKEIRKNVPQFLFYGGIEPKNLLKLRKEIKDNLNESDKEIDVILYSGGGSPHDAYRIIRTFRKNYETVNVIIPFWAKSAATLLAFGATKIIMDEFAEFGPLDAQIYKEREDSPTLDIESALNDEYSLQVIEHKFLEMGREMYGYFYHNEIVKINKTDLLKEILGSMTKFYEPLMRQINPYKLGEKRRYLSIGESYANRILIQFNKVEDDKRRKLVNYLVNGCPDHGYIIDYDVIKTFLNNVQKPEEFCEALYKNALSDLSRILMNTTEELNFIGYVFNPENKQQDNQNVPELINKTKEKNVDNKNNTNFAPNEPNHNNNKGKIKSKST